MRIVVNNTAKEKRLQSFVDKIICKAEKAAEEGCDESYLKFTGLELLGIEFSDLSKAVSKKTDNTVRIFAYKGDMTLITSYNFRWSMSIIYESFYIRIDIVG